MKKPNRTAWMLNYVGVRLFLLALLWLALFN